MKYNAKILIVPGFLDRLNEEQQENIISFVSFLGDFTSQCQKKKKCGGTLFALIRPNM